MGENDSPVSKATILIAEDSLTQAEKLEHYLSTHGHGVIVTRNGKEALVAALENKPAIVITDVVMPEMDGYNLCKQIKATASLKDIPVVLLTSLSRPQDIIKGLECGSDSFIRKPYDEKYLLSRIDYILTNRELRRTERLQVGVQLRFGGQLYFVTAERQQILDLLISTYEGAIQINEELEVKQRELQEANGALEERVAARTTELAQANEQLKSELAERKKAEEEIKRLNQDLERRVEERTTQLAATNKELEAFSYSVSHDLRSPLRHISGFANSLVGDYGDHLAPEVKSQLMRIQGSAQKMGRMIDDLLNLSRLERSAMDLRMTSLNALIDSVRTDLEPEMTGRNIEWRIAALPLVSCDSGLMQQVFANLLSNAVKYTRRRDRAVIEIGQSNIDGQLVLFVRDNGAGFEQKYADKLFGAFQRLHSSEDFEGTGVGLATVQRIIRKHGGRIWAEAALDKGATFFMTFAESAQSDTTNPGPELLAPSSQRSRATAGGVD